MALLWTFKLFCSEKQKKIKMAESSEQIRNSDGNPATQSTKSGINDTISASSPILRLTGDPGEYECFQEGNGNGLRISLVVHLLSPGFQEQRPSHPSPSLAGPRQAECILEIRVWGAILLHPHQTSSRTLKAALC